MTVSYLPQTLVTGISSGVVPYMMVAGMLLITSGVNAVNFGQGALLVLGTYLYYSLAPMVGFIPALIIILFVVGFLRWFVEWVMGPLFGKNMLYIMFLTFGVAYIVCDAMIIVWGYSIRLLTSLKFLNGPIAIFGIRPLAYYLFMIVVGVLTALAFQFMTNKTRSGMLMRATIRDRETAACLGINVNCLPSIMFIIGMGITGLSGVTNTPVTGMSPREGLSIFGNIMSILIIGGMRNINGCLLAALLAGLVNTFGVIFFPQFYNLLSAALMVICMFIRPNGVSSKKEV